MERDLYVVELLFSFCPFMLISLTCCLFVCSRISSSLCRYRFGAFPALSWYYLIIEWEGLQGAREDLQRAFDLGEAWQSLWWAWRTGYWAEKAWDWAGRASDGVMGTPEQLQKCYMASSPLWDSGSSDGIGRPSIGTVMASEGFKLWPTDVAFRDPDGVLDGAGLSSFQT